MTLCKGQCYRRAALVLAVAGLVGGAAAPADAAPHGTWVLTGNLNLGRDGQTATLLPSNGRVVVAGGETNMRGHGLDGVLRSDDRQMAGLGEAQSGAQLGRRGTV